MRISTRWNRTASLAVVFLACSGLQAAGGGPTSGRVTIPATTPFTVKLDQAVSLKTTVSGESFTVTFNEPVQVDGVTVIPAGSSGAGVAHKDPQNSSQMEMNSVFINGRSYRVMTSPITFNHKDSFSAGTKLTFQLMFSLNVGK